MINLLPLETKREFRAARINTQLIRYVVALALTAVGLFGILGVSFVLNERNKAQYTLQKAESDQKLGTLNDTRAKVQLFNDNIKRAASIYGSEVILSDIVTDIAKYLPPGAVIGTLTLDARQIATPLNLSVRVDSFNKGAVLKKNFEDSGFFKDVKLVGIESSKGSGLGEKYSFAVTITATIVPANLKKAAMGSLK